MAPSADLTVGIDGRGAVGRGRVVHLRQVGRAALAGWEAQLAGESPRIVVNCGSVSHTKGQPLPLTARFTAISPPQCRSPWMLKAALVPSHTQSWSAVIGKNVVLPLRGGVSALNSHRGLGLCAGPARPDKASASLMVGERAGLRLVAGG